MKSGFIGIIGRPNVGKSTFLNAVLKEKIAITSNKAQTTLNKITGIYTDLNYNDGEGLQIVFLDTPGMHKPQNALGEAINETAKNSLNDVDVILLIVDGTKAFGTGDERVLELIEHSNKPKILAINKMDQISPEQYLNLYNIYENNRNFEEIFGISSLKGENIDEIMNFMIKYLKDGPMYYPEDISTNESTRFIVSEIIREKTLLYLDDEVPHGIAVEIESYNSKERFTEISAVIYCERKSHKSIIIGKSGKKIKGIGKSARLEIEELLGTKVFLNLWVKVKENWRDSNKMIKYFGYSEEK